MRKKSSSSVTLAFVAMKILPTAISDGRSRHVKGCRSRVGGKRSLSNRIQSCSLQEVEMRADHAEPAVKGDPQSSVVVRQGLAVQKSLAFIRTKTAKLSAPCRSNEAPACPRV